MAVFIRLARASDADRIAHLTSQLGYEVSSSVVEARLRAILSRSDQQFLVAEENDDSLGWLHAMVIACLETGPFAMISGLVVDAAHRRQGIGRLLMQHAEKWADEQGCGVVRLWSSAGRGAAHQFYRGIGYTNIKTQYSFGKALDPRRKQDLEKLIPRIDAESL
jgi:GNAT superfamily N-acetyltransferase